MNNLGSFARDGAGRALQGLSGHAERRDEHNPRPQPLRSSQSPVSPLHGLFMAFLSVTFSWFAERKLLRISRRGVGSRSKIGCRGDLSTAATGAARAVPNIRLDVRR